MLFPSVMAPAVLAQASPSAVAAPWSAIEALGDRVIDGLAGTQVLPWMASVNVAERNLQGGSDFFVPNNPSDGLRLTRDWGPGQALLETESTSYVLQDSQFPASTHARSELGLRAAYDWRFMLRPYLAATYGLGYGLRSVSVQNAGSAPQPSFIFSSVQLYQGPEIRTGLAWLGWPVATLGVDAIFQPYMLCMLDPGVPALPPLNGRCLEAWIQSASWKRASLRVAYRHEIADTSDLELSRRTDGLVVGLMLAF